MSLLVNGEYVDDTLLREEANLVRTKLVEAMPDDDPLAIDMRAWEWARENVIERVSRPSGKEIAEYYRQHRENFYAPELVHAGHIVKNVDERTGATAALA